VVSRRKILCLKGMEVQSMIVVVADWMSKRMVSVERRRSLVVGRCSAGASEALESCTVLVVVVEEGFDIGAAAEGEAEAQE
jgi:hypothetical protein